MPIPEITAIDHVSVLITDIERSRQFYTGILGLKEIAKPRTFQFKVIWYDLGGGQTLHLLLKPMADNISPRHFALKIRSVEEARSYFRSKGIPFEETTLIPGCDRFFIQDPDGNRIEIIQWLEPYHPATSGAPAFDRG